MSEGERVLVVSPFVPARTANAAGIAFLSAYFQLLRLRFDAHLIAPATEENIRQHRNSPFRDKIDLLPAKTLPLWRVPLRVGKGLSYYSPFTPQALPALTRAATGADLVEFQWAETYPLARNLRAKGITAPFTAIAHDLFFDFLKARVLRARWSATRIAAVLSAPSVRLDEARLLASFDLVSVFTPYDELRLRKYGVRSGVALLDPPLETLGFDSYGPIALDSSPTQDLLFVGAFDRPENYEGIDWFLAEVWPSVKQQVPVSRVWLVGANPPSRWQQRQADGVHVTGWVDSVVPYYRQASIFVTPLFTGAGLKFKVAQAMAAGLPVVGTPYAMRGIGERGGSVFVAAATNDPTEMATAICNLLADPERTRLLGSAAQRWAEGEFAFDRRTEAMFSAYSLLIRKHGQRPQGSLTQHEQRTR